MSELTYQSTGVNYDLLDAFKRACQKAAASTSPNLQSHNLREPPGIRGESAYLLETPHQYLAHVEEGLGTKNLVADAMLELTGQSFYKNIGIDVVATIVNDLITCGALPISIAMHAAVGDATWFNNTQRANDLAEGFAHACNLSNAVWGGGETPALKGIVNPNSIVLAGSALGTISPKSNRIPNQIHPNDAIIMLASSGVQTNGLTLCRALAEKLPNGYLTPTPDHRPYGQALLDPSIIYVKFLHAAQQAKIDLHYLVHLTGHGWRKLMRHPEPFIYNVTTLAPQLPIFDFLKSQGPISDRELYNTFNMGAGFAAYVPQSQAQKTIQTAQQAGYTAWQAGTITKDSSRKTVIIHPLNLTYESDTLSVRE